MHYHTTKKTEKKILTNDKMKPQHVYMVIHQIIQLINIGKFRLPLPNYSHLVYLFI